MQDYKIREFYDNHKQSSYFVMRVKERLGYKIRLAKGKKNKVAVINDKEINDLLTIALNYCNNAFNFRVAEFKKLILDFKERYEKYKENNKND